MQQSLISLINTSTNPLPLLLRLRTNPSPPPLHIPTPQPNTPPSLELKLQRRERSIVHAKDRCFNVEMVVEEGDDLEECLHRFNRHVARTGLLKECRRRRFHENAREKRKRKQRDAALLRRKNRLYKQKGSSKRNEETPIEKDDMKGDFWAFSDESFEELIDDEKEESNEEIESRFQDDGEGSHTIGLSRCTSFRQRLYNQTGNDLADSTLGESFAAQLHGSCPRSGGDNNLFPLDQVSPTQFDNFYYKNILYGKGLLSSDQILFTKSPDTMALVKLYAENRELFLEQFAKSMVKMGNISPLTGYEGEVRKNCSFDN